MIYFILFFLSVLVIFPKEIASGVSDSLSMCFNAVVPSLFPFMIISNLTLITRPVKESNPVFRFISRIFKISPDGVWAFLLGLICGYPVGGKIACELFEENKISEKEKDRLILFCNNGGPGFILGTAGGMFLNSIKAGVIIYISHILASVTIGLISGFFGKAPLKYKLQNRSDFKFSSALISSVTGSISSLINVVGIISMFGALIKILELVLPFYISPEFKGIFYGMLEMTNGIRLVSQSGLSLQIKASLSAFLISFSGISVYMQLKCFSDNIKTAPYFLSKMLSGLIAMIYCFILFGVTV